MSRVPASSPSATTNDPLDFANYYPSLSHITYESEVIPLSEPEGNALRRLCEEKRHSLDPNSLVKPDDKIALDAIASSIDAAILRMYGTETRHTPVFIRLSTRSPKDARLGPKHAGEMSALIDEALVDLAVEDSHGYEGTDDIDQDTAVAAVTRACVAINQVTSGDQAVALLGSSRRVFQDLTGRLLVADDAHPFAMSVIVRKWDDVMVPEAELRVWIYNGTVTAVSQYYKALWVSFFDRVTSLSDLEDQVNAFLTSSLLPALPESIPSCVADIAVGYPDPDTGILPLSVVELNHFAATTSPALFDWTEDEDVLCDQSAERPVWRIRQSSTGHARSSLYLPLRNLLDDMYPIPDPNASSWCTLL